MRLSTIRLDKSEVATVVTKNGVVPIAKINELLHTSYKTNMYSLICADEIPQLNQWYNNGGRSFLEDIEDTIPFEKVVYAPLYRTPNKIFCIGLNYKEHAEDLCEQAPKGFPGSFFKPSTTIIGPGDEVKIPLLSNVTDGEGELAVVLGKKCKDVPKENWLDYVAGFTIACDMTSLDILAKNTRFLTIAKSFDTFLGLSHQLVTTDEIKDVFALRVRTVLNGDVFAENTVDNMTFTPDFLISFLSKIMTWLPGDILSTGTPRGVHIKHGDVIEGQIDGFESLRHPVIDLKKTNIGGSL